MVLLGQWRRGMGWACLLAECSMERRADGWLRLGLFRRRSGAVGSGGWGAARRGAAGGGWKRQAGPGVTWQQPWCEQAAVPLICQRSRLGRAVDDARRACEH